MMKWKENHNKEVEERVEEIAAAIEKMLLEYFEFGRPVSSHFPDVRVVRDSEFRGEQTQEHPSKKRNPGEEEAEGPPSKKARHHL